MVKSNIEDAFVRHILNCFGYKRMTQYDIEMRYDKLYPPGIFSPRWMKKKVDQQSPTVSAQEALVILLENGYINKEIYQDEEGDRIMYYTTKKGVAYTLRKK